MFDDRFFLSLPSGEDSSGQGTPRSEEDRRRK